MRRFRAELDDVADKVARVFKALDAEMEGQFEEYISSYLSVPC
jgi:hypothetical protein